MAGGEIIILQDYEEVLQRVDRIIAQLDVQPIQVLIEAVIVQVKLEKDGTWPRVSRCSTVPGKVATVLGSGGGVNSAAGFSPSSVLTTAGKLSTGLAGNAYGMKIGFVGDSVTGFINALETKGDTKVLAAPRILVLNKQRAEIHLGDQLGYATQTTTQTSTSEEVKYLNIGTQLRFRPFVSSDGMIRLEIHPERSTGKLDDNGIPQTNTAQLTTNVLIPDGTTIVLGGLIDTEKDARLERTAILEPDSLPRLPVPPHRRQQDEEGTDRDSDAPNMAAGMPRGGELLGASSHVGPGRADRTEGLRRSQGRVQPPRACPAAGSVSAGRAVPDQ